MKAENTIIKTPYINLQSDYGFKRAFGSKKFRKVVLRFLKAALGDEINITRVTPHEVEYHDKEILPSQQKGKRIMYDVYFTMKVSPETSALKPHYINKEDKNKDIEHHFIFEMQNVYAPPFEDRITFYSSRMITVQGEPGWNYDLDPVILVGIIDFDFPHLSKRLVHDFELREKYTGESLTKKLRILFYSLKHVPARWEECESDIERQLYLIKNMDKLDKNSKPYLDGGYEAFFEAAESSGIVGEEAVRYSQSLSHLREVQAGLDYRYDEGVAVGEQRGIAIGEEQERMAMARRMKEKGYGPSVIADITGLTEEQIELL